MEIDSYFIDENDYKLFVNDLKTKRAVERNLEIIGEAVNRILKKEESFDLIHARKIVDT